MPKISLSDVVADYLLEDRPRRAPRIVPVLLVIVAGGTALWLSTDLYGHAGGQHSRLHLLAVSMLVLLPIPVVGLLLSALLRER
jgi:TRAP-type C4-dicarboxylate transport system permease small subunit